MRIINCEQKSEEWWNVRRGIPTASEFERIMTPKTMKPSAGQEGYICQLLAERFAPVWPLEDGFMNSHMAYGIDTEKFARAFYEFDRNVEVQQVGFCLSDCGRFGCSPDGLIGEDGGLELKCPKLETHIRYLLDGELPSEYRCQVHGELFVTGRKWWDFVSYADGLPAFVIRVLPDEFTAALGEQVLRFCDRYAESLQSIESLVLA